ncbi:MAG: LysM peptidoglycan-binding domain-containing protein [Nitrososphaerales archaeon]
MRIKRVVVVTLPTLLILMLAVFALVTSTSATAASNATTYVVKSSDSLFKIGQELGVSWQSIAQANSIQPPYIIYVGETLIIPLGGGLGGSSSTTSASCSSTPALQPLYYAVQSGDSLYQIGLNFGINWENIAQADGITPPYFIYVGQQLIIPSSGTVTSVSCSSSGSSSSLSTTTLTSKSTATTTTTTTSSGSSSGSSSQSRTTYTVKSGDYLYLIGEEFNVPWQNIAEANNIQSPYILYVGEVLLIPTGSTTTTTTTTTSTYTSFSSLSTTTSSSSTSSICGVPSPALTTSARNVGQELISLNPNEKYVVLRFDDSFQDQWINALPVLQQYHFKAVFLAITGAITNQGQGYSFGDGWVNLSWQEFQWLYDNGYEISDHSMTHADLTTLSCSGLYSEVYLSRQMLFNNGITYVPSFSLPYGSGVDNSTAMNYIYASGFSHVYPDGQDHNSAITNYNFDTIHTQWYEIDAANNESLSYFNSVVNQASGSNVIGIFMHHVDDHVAGTTYYVNVTNFQQDMAYLANNGFTVILPSELPEYQLSDQT